ncbi:MAG: PD-(D/E)XK nuclease family protein [Oscillospiraceae bacterium]|jgi:ATP-dependent helicase/nuclease subunit B|nr:PD-(D/E)XK nuclease family protein [Oscillospiraceae bacterium]
MLQIYTGAPGCGKTRRLLKTIGLNARLEGAPRQLLIIPEQYSYESERALAEICGDELCLHAEALTFTSLAERVFEGLNIAPLRSPKREAKLLLMYSALNMLTGSLKVYTERSTKTYFLEKFVKLREEFSYSKVFPDDLSAAADLLGSGATALKLRDLALIFEAYDALLVQRYGDKRTNLDLLTEVISDSANAEYYFDGFSDFTAQEFELIEKLLLAKRQVTIALTTGGEGYELSGETLARLQNFASENAVKTETVALEASTRDIRRTLYATSGIAEECRLATAQTLDWLRAGIAPSAISIVARGFSSYEAALQASLSKAGIKSYLNRDEDILQKPIMTLVTEVFSIIAYNWRQDSVFRFLKTNLTGLTIDERDKLEDYALKWNLRGAGKWRVDFTGNPRGYVDYSDLDEERAEKARERDAIRLADINRCRKKIALPILSYKQASDKAVTGREHASALYSFVLDIKLRERLKTKVNDFIRSGDEQTADEYRQLWDIFVATLDTFVTISGEDRMSRDEFGRLLTLLLSGQAVDTIPMSSGVVRVGDFDSIRESDITHLFVLGATDEKLPNFTSPQGLLNPDERDMLKKFAALTNLRGDNVYAVQRELFLVNKVLDKATELVVTYPADLRLSYIIKRLNLNTSQTPARSAGAPGRLAGSYQLTRDALRALYGETPVLTATKAETLGKCRYLHFMKYGLRAEARKTVSFNSLEFGNLVHYALEHVCAEVKGVGGFAVVTREQLEAITQTVLDDYANNILGAALADKRARFLFNRLRDSVKRLVSRLASELKDSGFSPRSFEYEFHNITLGGVTIEGKVDRVDELTRDGITYARVVDYKTGGAEFSLSDVYYGLGMQLLIYLFALEKSEGLRPAGIRYTPAKDILITLGRKELELSDEAIDAKRAAKLKSSGLQLAEAADGGTAKDIATAEQIGTLSRHVEEKLAELYAALTGGDITPEPYAKKNASPCDYCDYEAACRFNKRSGAYRKITAMKDEAVWEKLKG